jgi:hypothetical protein
MRVTVIYDFAGALIALGLAHEAMNSKVWKRFIVCVTRGIIGKGHP